jgi:hypothetical protein
LKAAISKYGKNVSIGGSAMLSIVVADWVAMGPYFIFAGPKDTQAM